MHRHLADLAAQLRQSAGPWITGQQYTLADVTWSCILLRLDETGWLGHFLKDDTLEPINAYYDALKGRDSWKAAITDKTHPIVEQAEINLKAAINSDPAVAKALYC